METKIRKSRYLTLDIDGNDNWFLKGSNERNFGNNLKTLLNSIDYILYNTYILVNRDFLVASRIFSENGLVLNEDYKMPLYSLGELKGLTYVNKMGKTIYLRSYASFFNVCPEYEEQEKNNDEMIENIKWLSKVSGYRFFFKNYDLEKLILADFKTKVNWSENFSHQITQDEFDNLYNWAFGAFNYLKEEHKNKIIKATAFDKNSYYQSKWANNLVPKGKPIYGDNVMESDCEHDLILLKIRLTAKLKPNHLPVLVTRKDYFHVGDKIDPIYDCEQQVFYVTLDKLTRIIENYDITGFWFIEQICFETYKGDGFKKFNELWIDKIKNSCKIPAMRNNIKVSINKILGCQASRKNKSYEYYFATGFNENGEIVSNKKEINKISKYVPYVPLYIFVTDHARNEMYDICLEFYDYLIMCNTDAVVLTEEVSVEQFGKKYEVSPEKVGAFKVERELQYFFFSALGSYVSAKSIDKKGDIVTYKHIGVSDSKALNTIELSLEDVVKLKLGEKENK